jgi:hypothetical protein
MFLLKIIAILAGAIIWFNTKLAHQFTRQISICTSQSKRHQDEQLKAVLDYSQTCLQRPCLGLVKSGHCNQVAVIQRVFYYLFQSQGLLSTGRYRQVVVIQHKFDCICNKSNSKFGRWGCCKYVILLKISVGLF